MIWCDLLTSLWLSQVFELSVQEFMTPLLLFTPALFVCVCVWKAYPGIFFYLERLLIDLKNTFCPRSLIDWWNSCWSDKIQAGKQFPPWGGLLLPITALLCTEKHALPPPRGRGLLFKRISSPSLTLCHLGRSLGKGLSTFATNEKVKVGYHWTVLRA